jgi:hypothetical protein
MVRRPAGECVAHRTAPSSHAMFCKYKAKIARMEDKADLAVFQCKAAPPNDAPRLRMFKDESARLKEPLASVFGRLRTGRNDPVNRFAAGRPIGMPRQKSRDARCEADGGA